MMADVDRISHYHAIFLCADASQCYIMLWA